MLTNNPTAVVQVKGKHSVLCARVSLLLERSLNADVNFVFAGNKGQLVVADIALNRLL